MKIFRWSLVVLVIYFIFYQSIQDAIASSNISSSFLNVIYAEIPVQSFDIVEAIIRKMAHFTEFATLMATILFANIKYPLLKKNSDLIYPIAMVTIPFIDECIQLFSNGRSCSVYDMLLDASGMFFVLLMYNLFKLIKKRILK